MKIKLFALLFFFSYNSCFAQDKIDSFNKAVDYCNCMITYAYLNQLTASMKDGKIEKKSFEDIRASVSNCEIGKSNEYSKLSDLLNNNNFTTSNKKVSALIDKVKEANSNELPREKAAKTIIDGIFLNKDLKNIISTFSDVAKLQPQLTNDLNKYFEIKAVPGRDTTPNTTATELDTKINSAIETKWGEYKHDIIYMCIFSILIAIALSVIIFLILRSKLVERINRHRTEIDNLATALNQIGGNLNDALKVKKEKFPGNNQGGNNQKDVSPTQKEFQEYKSYVDNKLSEIIDSIQRIQRDGGDSKNKGNEAKSNSNSYTGYTNDAKTKSEIFYASIPNKDGSFSEMAITKVINPTASFYKFTVLDSYSQKATFEFLNEERAIKDATNAPERILRPVCKINNALNQNAVRIKTITPGVVIKRNDKWELETQAVIEYE